MALVVEGEVRTDDLPGLAAVVGLMHVLTADVDAVVVVGRHCHGPGAVPALLDVFGRPPVGGLGPGPDPSRLTGAKVHAREVAVVATGPDDVVVGPVANGE